MVWERERAPSFFFFFFSPTRGDSRTIILLAILVRFFGLGLMNEPDVWGV